MRIIISGSRCFDDYEKMSCFVMENIIPTDDLEIVSGGLKVLTLWLKSLPKIIISGLRYFNQTGN
jgi:hypothetical protein